ncbi:Rpn family recombination-promoting nuclease/putative transposase [Providencia rettgeri]|uniref:Rpn family recombination-promoting nuclease/putative transposase n=1 Tax=Providencia rettgeri TaxID=587 RepID=UPI00226E1801|nr:Rpn family recombination-promoting nuclease/putative transposase [Providencia rettgeri]EJF7710666.1 Rpn family recombination-promoting nuclease/putative transposase [Providencia rettgeri]MCX9110389.1 Rpn family recombination-promoting nuclease/putative transposase [Providencia rettgeri]MCX9116403.1 Rpn family recombination-promoting nuclease/putative transposase [Providencia rettgeri]
MVKNHSSTPHDAAFKGFMSKLDNARDFFDIHLPSHIKQLCDFKTLAITNSSFIDNQLRTRLSDMLYTVEAQQGEGYIYMLVEHQSTPDKLMGWRMMHYSFLAMNQHLQQGHHDLPLVVPVLFYHGKVTPYPYAKPWTHCFPWPEIASNLYSQPFPLVDITVIDDNEFVNHRKVAVMELAMKHRDLRDNIEKVTQLLAEAMNQNYHHSDDIITIFNYLFITMDSPHFEIVVNQLIDQIENNQEAIMNIAQRLKNQGIQEGIDIGVNRGIDIGANKKQHEVALKGLQLGTSIELICQLTGLTHQEVLNLQ